mmetsp:Transcript_15941/g.40663  ORF Transcript_15941/g.40663 Transcript_15941/m.40663 type:complete len:262 (+) Transcript_15941:164-949(+)
MSRANTAAVFYREFLRQIRRLEKAKCTKLAVREPIRLDEWGHGQFCKLKPSNAYYAATLNRLLPWLSPSEIGEFPLVGLRDLIKLKFRDASPATEEERHEALDQALSALTELIRQVKLQFSSSVRVTNGMRVEAWSSYIRDPEMNAERSDLYLFAYRLRIENVGLRKVQLVGRHWKIHDSRNGLYTEVPKRSPGVVGQTPILRPGDIFEYASGTNLSTSKGVIEGSFQMEEIEETGRRKPFDAKVGPFQLIGPNKQPMDIS